ncbi:MAG: hypothetical protein Q8P81_01710 [Nanoarchaeota archaeon]|nr:hypothetical protein [Nanoarchaeota archaeon]
MSDEIRCNICERNFGSAEALEMHNSVKHSEGKNKTEMRSGKSKRGRNWGIFIIVFVLVVWGASVLINKQGEYEEFAQCINDSGAKMYGAYWCSACSQQKRILGDSKNIPWVECSLPNRAGQTAECISEGIQSYPTWEFSDGSRMVGVLSREELSDKTGCVLN